MNRVVMVVVVVDWTDGARVERRGGECVHNKASPSLGIYEIRSKTNKYLMEVENAKILPTQESLSSDTS